MEQKASAKLRKWLGVPRNFGTNALYVGDRNVHMLCPGVRCVVLLCDDVYLKGSVPGRLQSI